MDPNTWDSTLDNMLRPAQLGGWIEADMACEHLVRVLKDNYKARAPLIAVHERDVHSEQNKEII
jgi:hypothetical protein